MVEKYAFCYIWQWQAASSRERSFHLRLRLRLRFCFVLFGSVYFVKLPCLKKDTVLCCRSALRKARTLWDSTHQCMAREFFIYLGWICVIVNRMEQSVQSLFYLRSAFPTVNEFFTIEINIWLMYSWGFHSLWILISSVCAMLWEWNIEDERTQRER